MLAEQQREMAACVNWLCAAAIELPKPLTVDAMPKIQDHVRGWKLCDSSQFYLANCVPSHNLELGVLSLLDAGGIDFCSGDFYLGVCRQGFVAITSDISSCVHLLDLTTGAVYFLSIERFNMESLYHPDRGYLPVTHENVIEVSTHAYQTLVHFLSELKQSVRAWIIESLWECTLGAEGPIAAEHPHIHIPDEEYVESLRMALSTPVDARAVRDENGKTLLDVAREKGRSSVIPMLEEYWVDPEKFKIYPPIRPDSDPSPHSANNN